MDFKTVISGWWQVMSELLQSRRKHFPLITAVDEPQTTRRAELVIANCFERHSAAYPSRISALPTNHYPLATDSTRTGASRLITRRSPLPFQRIVIRALDINHSPRTTALRPLVTASVLFLLLCGFADRSFAQTDSASLSGTIVDRQGGLVPDAQVSIVNTDTNVTFHTKTNGAGVYNAPVLRPGNYRMLVTKQGFKQIDLREITLHTQDSINRNFTLEVGGTSETIIVNANSSSETTESPAVSMTVTHEFVENTPLNGRSFQDLIALAPGAVTANDASGLFSVNGQREDSNYYTVDGIAANLNPDVNNIAQGMAGTLPAQTALGTTQALTSVDSLQEFKIQTSGYTAEYGRQPGGQIELTTRSGSNNLHGSVFDYFRNEALDANSWFFNANGIPRQAERQNDFGGTIGGPVEIPHVYDGTDKMFFFMSYEGLKMQLPQFSGISNVPTVAFRQFAAPAVQPFLNAKPLPNGPDNGDQCASSLGLTFACTAQWSSAYSDPSSLHSLSVRVDQYLGQKVQLFVRYADTPSQQSSEEISEITTSTTNTRALTAGMTANLSANLMDQLRFNYSESEGTYSATPNAFGGAVPYAKDLILPTQYAPPGTGYGSYLYLQVPNARFFTLPLYTQYSSTQHQFNILDGLSWIHGRHALKFGADYRRLSPVYNPEQYYTQLRMTSLAAVQEGFANAGEVMASGEAHPIFQNFSLYAQDHLKLTSRLTLDYGLRWEFNPAPGASDGVYPLALTTGNLASAQLAAPGTPQYRTRYDNFAPRLGFAYEVITSQTHPVVMRGGFGIFYDTGQAEGAAGYQGYPFSVTNVLSNVALPASDTAIAPPSLSFPLTQPYPTISVNTPNLKLPYTEQWNLSLDLGLGAKNTLTTSYVGNAGRQLLLTPSVDLSPVNPSFTYVAFTSNAASSSYNALQVQDQGFIGAHTQVIASYTWAHAIDDASTDNGGFAPLRGNSDNDVRQVFNAALNYQIPGLGSKRFARTLTSGWSMDYRFSALSGYPLDPIQGYYFLPNGSQEEIRPNLVPGVPVVLHNQPGALGGWALNYSAFSQVPTDPTTGAPLEPGNLGRNSIHGPAFWNLNAALQKDTSMYERLHLLFRVEAFNLFNHPNAGGIDTFLPDGSGIFGISGGAQTIGVPNQLYANGASRSLQISLKLQF